MGVSATDEGNNDVAVAASGGSTFDSRLADLSAARAMLAEAYNDLRIGRDAKAEYESAAADRAKASDELKRAKDEGDNMRAVARSEADAIVADADERRKGMLDQAAGKATEAAEAADAAKGDRAAAAQELADAKADRAAREKALAKREAEVAGALDAIREREEAAATAEKRWTDALAALNSVITNA